MPLNEKETTERRSKQRQEYGDREQRDTKSCYFDGFGCCALTSDYRDSSDVAVFDRSELDEVGIQTRSLTGLTRKQPMSASAKRKLKDFEQLQGRCENPLASTAGPTAGDAVPDTREKSDAKHCVSTPKTPVTAVASDSDAPVERPEQEAEWFHKDQDQDTAYEALKHIKLNLNYFLESFTEVQPDKISVDVVQYPTTAKDIPDIYKSGTFVKDFHIPNRHVISSSASPEKSSIASKTKYNLQIPVSRLRDLIFPRRVETTGRKIFKHHNDAVLNNSSGGGNTPGDQCSSALSLNVATNSSVPRNNVVLVKTHHLPKYIRMDNTQSHKKLTLKRPKIELIDDHLPPPPDALGVVCPSAVEARGDTAVVCQSPGECDHRPAVVCINKGASVVHGGERLPMYVANGGTSNNNRPRINKCPPPVVKGGGGRKFSGYADIVHKRVTLIEDRKRNNQFVTKRILPAKQLGRLL